MYTTFVLPLVSYNTQVWNPYRLGLIRKLESVQRRFTKRIPALRELDYPSRLSALGLQTLESRRFKSDLCLLYKIIFRMVEVDFVDYFKFMTCLRTRNSHPLKLQLPTTRNEVSVDYRRFSFANRVIPEWNAIPNDVLDRIVSLQSFCSEMNRIDLSIFERFLPITKELNCLT
jgi:hypothetical protein